MNGERAEPKRNAEHCDKHGIGCLAPKIQRFGSQLIFQSEFKAQNYLAEASESRSGRDLAILATKYAMKKYTVRRIPIIIDGGFNKSNYIYFYVDLVYFTIKLRY